MRTTIRIDDELLGKLKEEARKQNLSLTRVLDRTLRAGMHASRSPRRSRRRYREQTYRMGVPTVALDKALSLAAALEDKEIIRKMMLRK
jgi:predicted transcriptional regulator